MQQQRRRQGNDGLGDDQCDEPASRLTRGEEQADEESTEAVERQRVEGIGAIPWVEVRPQWRCVVGFERAQASGTDDPAGINEQKRTQEVLHAVDQVHRGRSGSGATSDAFVCSQSSMGSNASSTRSSACVGADMKSSSSMRSIIALKWS